MSKLAGQLFIKLFIQNKTNYVEWSNRIIIKKKKKTTHIFFRSCYIIKVDRKHSVYAFKKYNLLHNTAYTTISEEVITLGMYDYNKKNHTMP